MPRPDTLLLLAGVSLGLSAAMLVLVARDRQANARLRGLVVLLAAAGAAHSVLAVAPPIAPPWGSVPVVLALLGVVGFWQLVRVLFADRSGWQPFLAWCALLAVALPACRAWLPGGAFAALVTLAAAGFVSHALWTLAAGARDDLDAQRRDFRAWWLLGIALYVLLVLAAHHTAVARWAPLAHAAALLAGQVVLKLGWLWMCAADTSLLGRLSQPEPTPAPSAPRSAPIDEGPDRAPERQAEPLDQALALRQVQARAILDALERDHLYRQARLTVGDLAAHVRLPEARVRLVINQHLGWRNFNVFLNAFRLAEAAIRLRAADSAHLPVLTIALSVGFGSIGPFNRAFRERFGVTPTAYRAGSGPAPGPLPPQPAGA